MEDNVELAIGDGGARYKRHSYVPPLVDHKDKLALLCNDKECPHTRIQDDKVPDRCDCSELASHHKALNIPCTHLHGIVKSRCGHMLAFCHKIDHRRWSQRDKACSSYTYDHLGRVYRQAHSKVDALLDDRWRDIDGHNPSVEHTAPDSEVDLFHRPMAAQCCSSHKRKKWVHG